MKLPILRFDRLLHVGEMDPALKRHDSYEGSGLSVSLHPSAWRIIARGYVSGPCWELRREGGLLLDAHRVRGALAREVLAWGVAAGHVVAKDLWRVSWWDDELDDRMSMIFDDAAEAREEARDREIRSRRIRGHVSTPSLDVICMQTRPSLGDRSVIELLLPLWARSQHGLDGVWWSDRLSPVTLSAPRGVLAADVVDKWTATRLDHDPDEGDTGDEDFDEDEDDHDD